MMSGWVLLAVVGGGVVFAVGGGGKQYQIVTPSSAGGLLENTDVDALIKPATTSAKSQLQSLTGGTVDKLVYATYFDGHRKLVFIGASGNSRTLDGLLSKMRSFNSDPSAVSGVTSTWTEVDPGPHGGKGACGERIQTQVKISVCVWQTSSTFGELLVMPPATTPAASDTSTSVPVTELADIMRRMRPDLELEK